MVSRIRKRDGRIVPFDQAKIAAAISGAGRTVGHGDDLLSEELASVVTLFLEKTVGQGIPSVEDVRDYVERVLMETGHPEAARAFILYGERRAKRLEALRVLETGAGENGDGGRRLEVDRSSRCAIHPFSKVAIVADLVNGIGTPPSLASEIASKVEDRILRSGLVRISSSLVRELVDNELFNRGFSGRTFGGMRVSLAASRIKALAEGDPEGRIPAELTGRVTDDIMRQFSLRELFSPEEVELHLRGEGIIEGLSLPTGYLAASLDPRLLPEPFGSPEAPPAYLHGAVRFLDRFVADSVAIDLGDFWIDRSCRVGGDVQEWMREVIATLASGPAGTPSPRRSPLLWIFRSPSPAAERLVANSGGRLRTAADLLEDLIEAALEGVRDLGRELAVPRLHIDLQGARPPQRSLLFRAAVMEAAGRISLGAQGFEEIPLAAVQPLVAGLKLDLEAIQKSAGCNEGREFLDALQSALLVAAGAFNSKNRYLAGLHRSCRGPKAALRRFMGGDGSIVGPGVFRVVPVRLGRAAIRASRSAGGPGGFICEVMRFVRAVLAEESRRLGIRIRLDPPWTFTDRELSGLFEEDPGKALTVGFECGVLSGFGILPDFWVGDAAARVEYIEAIIRARSEQGHAA